MLFLFRSLRVSIPLSKISQFPKPKLHKYTTMAPLPPDTRPIIISGPSGVGKGTLYKLLLDRHPSVFCTSISHTTRDPRPGETRDVDYYYTTMEQFEKMIGEEGFVEHAKFGGNRYGTSRKMIEDVRGRGKVVVLDIEMEVGLFFCFTVIWEGIKGADLRAIVWEGGALRLSVGDGVKQIHNSPISARYIFIAPPSMTILEQRLRGRGTEKEDSIQKRLQQAKNELEYSKTEGVHDIIIVNDDLKKAYKEMEEFIFAAKKD
ncbi:hypothetical protein HYALB_00006008 [Hymenoscyphus albidus]|uniref:Guanylate kinase-like domain-containing protein n=1 Tax=Hymenoscyphus albidus TaxID=595503 RepID=A0A9N9LPY2_9HELO|nr:hypothetical protein HYALB_00006008 [Hymenoscyphus albidus]